MAACKSTAAAAASQLTPRLPPICENAAACPKKGKPEGSGLCDPKSRLLSGETGALATQQSGRGGSTEQRKNEYEPLVETP